MSNKKITLTVYGAEERCASCVNAPGSKETYEWLQAAIARKYPNQSVDYRYVDIHRSQKNDKDEEYVEQILDDELFYPLVTINNEVVDEGTPRLKNVYKALENLGFKPEMEA
ncbi:YuzD family protein [Halobacillus sp. Marseille-Q1614]|uniref:YuzD family protein n=1 Tax=Halobacillus sp. Marseille-Q1614 TaxID=2709134 RepID=UPI0015713977|nr:YuzD family protein [Halobacillus sp. Marseille-Q1614]